MNQKWLAVRARGLRCSASLELAASKSKQFPAKNNLPTFKVRASIEIIDDPPSLWKLKMNSGITKFVKATNHTWKEMGCLCIQITLKLALFILQLQMSTTSV